MASTKRIHSIDDSDFYYFDVIWETSPKATFEIRATVASTGETAIVTNNAKLRAMLVGSDEANKKYEAEVWNLTGIEAQMLADKAIGLLNATEVREKIEEFMAEDRKIRVWEDDESVFEETFGLDDDDESFFDNDDFRPEGSEEELR